MDNLPTKALGDPRWSGSTALHGAVVSGQPSIVQYLVDHGARVDAKTKLGWTPLMLAGGVFFRTPRRNFLRSQTCSRKKWPLAVCCRPKLRPRNPPGILKRAKRASSKRFP